MKTYLFLLLSLGSFATLQAQDLRGGDYSFISVDSPLTFDVEVTLYFDTTEEPGLDTIRVWAEDLPRVAPLVGVTPLNRGIEAYLYRTTLVLSGGGQHNIFIDPALPLVAENIVSDSLIWPLYCNLDITPFTRPPFDSTLAVWKPFDFNYSINEDGELRLKMRGYDPDGDGTVYYTHSNWLNFLHIHDEVEVLPSFEDITLDYYSGDFIWQNPPGPGKYLLGFDLLGVTLDFLTTTNRFSRYLILELTEEDFMVSTSTDNPASPDVAVYPNPATDQLWLKFPENLGQPSAILYDVAGKRIADLSWQRGEREVTLDISRLPSGMYLLVNPQFSIRFVKQ
jgi:hypothetical protein